MSELLDRDGQPLEKGYHVANNRRKALYSLLGICEGLTADRELTHDEVVFLDVWLKENHEQLRHDPDYIDLADHVNDVLEDGIATHEELDDLLETLRTLVEYRAGEAVASERDEMEFLLGFLRGITADQELNEYEVLALRAWLRHTMLPTEKWPMSVLLERVRQIVKDRKIEDEEAADLLETVTSILGNGMDVGVASGMSTALPVDVVEAIEFDGRTFCITGKLASGPRKRCEDAIRQKGGTPQSSVTRKLDYLVIGTLASRDWAQSTHGTKIEKAMEIREKGGTVVVLSEEVLYRHL